MKTVKYNHISAIKLKKMDNKTMITKNDTKHKLKVASMFAGCGG